MSIFKKPWFLICLIPVFLLAYVLYRNIINIPVGDDIYVMEMFNQLKETNTWWEKLSILFSQHNEHRLVVTRILALIQYGISGSIDLRSWIILGNLSLIFIVILYNQHIGEQKWWIPHRICYHQCLLQYLHRHAKFKSIFGFVCGGYYSFLLEKILLQK